MFRARASLSLFAAPIVLLLACASEPPPRSPAEILRTRAAVDFECKESDVHTITIDDRSKQAWGCGHRAVYIEVCEKCQAYPGSRVWERCNCTWTMDTHRAPAPSAE